MNLEDPLPWEHDECVFTVIRRKEIKNYVLLWVYYPNCPNGHKIMVFDKDSSPSLDAKAIFPHFGRKTSPIARFVATVKGWSLAKKFAETC